MGTNALVVVAAVLAVGSSVAQQAANSVKDGVFTIEQANRGQLAYDKKCAECHGSMGTVTPAMAPMLNDYSFQLAWKDRSVGEFFERIRETMPQNEPRTLSPQDTIDIVSYILSGNQLPAGDRPLSSDIDVLSKIRLDTLP